MLLETSSYVSLFSVVLVLYWGFLLLAFLVRFGGGGGVPCHLYRSQPPCHMFRFLHILLAFLSVLSSALLSFGELHAVVSSLILRHVFL